MSSWCEEFRRRRCVLLSSHGSGFSSGSVRRNNGCFILRLCQAGSHSGSCLRRPLWPRKDAPVVCSRCGGSVSLFNRDLRTGLCPQCRKADRQAAEAEAEQEAEAARQIAAAEMAARRKLSGQDQRDEFRAKCSVCGDKRSKRGRVLEQGNLRFRLMEDWFGGYPLEALACLSCGHVRQFLQEVHRAELDSGPPPADPQHG